MEVTGISDREAGRYVSEAAKDPALSAPEEPEEDELASPFVESETFEDSLLEQEYAPEPTPEPEPAPAPEAPERERRAGFFSGLFHRRGEAKPEEPEPSSEDEGSDTVAFRLPEQETPEAEPTPEEPGSEPSSEEPVFEEPSYEALSPEEPTMEFPAPEIPEGGPDVPLFEEPEEPAVREREDDLHDIPGPGTEEAEELPEAEEKPLSFMQRIRRLWNDDDDDEDEEPYVPDEAPVPDIGGVAAPDIDPAAEPTQVADSGFSPELIDGPDDPYRKDETRLVERRKKRVKPEPEPEPEYEEPDLREECRRLAAECNDASLKSLVAVVIAVIMAILTFIFAGSGRLPFGIGDNIAAAAAALLVLQLIVSILCLKVLIRGVMDIIRLKPGAESLVALSGFITVVAGIQTILSPGSAVGLPYSAVSAFAAALALWGDKLQLRGMTDSLKTAVSTSEPLGVTAEHSEEINRVIIRKIPGKLDGFYNNLVSADVAESTYRIAAPIIAAASLILAFLASVGHGRGGNFLHIFAALLAAGASFSALLAYAAPFASAARRVRKSGAAIAGWGGADDICWSDGVCVRDEDIFPTGTLSLSGMKIYEGVSPEKAIRYTGSIIIASGSGLAKLFSGVLRQQGLSLVRVEDFKCYEGGVGGLIRGERVITGNVAFMNLMGIRIPDSMNMSNSVFTAVNDRLVAAFAINYVPANSVQNALVSLLKTKLKIYLTSRDFNVSPRLVEQKFKMPLEDIEYIPVSESYNISSDQSGDNVRTSAVICREGLAPFGEVITCSKGLRLAALIATAVSVMASAVGILLMFFLCWSGAFASAGAGTLLIYMLLALVLDLVACRLAGRG